MRKTVRILVKPQVCSGCLCCMTTCSLVQVSFVSLATARVRVELRPFAGTNKIVICRQCAKAPCKDACSEGAIVLQDESIWVIDQDRCNGCLKCLDACPFHAIFAEPSTRRVIKCELCDGDPECVQACPTGALSVQVAREKGT